MRRYLIVANQTLGGEQLTAKITECMNAGPCRFYLVAPVTQTEASDQWAAGGLDGGVVPGAYKIARALAAGRLQHELARLRETGAEADGEVVDPNPVDAIRKLASREEVDEVIVSTLPRRLSRWMAMDLPHRVRRATKLPVTQISGPAGPSL
jgi:hypothetical protein